MRRKVFDRSPQLELALGVTYYGLRRFPESVDQFFKTIDLAPDIPQPYAFLDPHAGASRRTAYPNSSARQRHSRRDIRRAPIGYLVQAKAIIGQLPAAGYPEEAEAGAEAAREGARVAGGRRRRSLPAGPAAGAQAGIRAGGAAPGTQHRVEGGRRGAALSPGARLCKTRGGRKTPRASA